MPIPYPQPSFNTTTQMMEYVKTVTDGWMFILVCIAIAVVIFIMLRTKMYRTSDSLLVASFLTLILGSFLWAAGLIPGNVVVLFLLFTMGSAIYSFFGS